ncbi:hypothetical protein [Pseudobacter ginsenosidimutans]|nr:hypothetical protein [Pseudobacter ginsenosidimutans]
MFGMHLLQSLKSIASITFQAMERTGAEQAFKGMVLTLVLVVI